MSCTAVVRRLRTADSVAEAAMGAADSVAVVKAEEKAAEAKEEAAADSVAMVRIWAPSNVQHVIFEGLADAVITCCGAGGGRWKRV